MNYHGYTQRMYENSTKSPWHWKENTTALYFLCRTQNSIKHLSIPNKQSCERVRIGQCWYFYWFISNNTSLGFLKVTGHFDISWYWLAISAPSPILNQYVISWFSHGSYRIYMVNLPEKCPIRRQYILSVTKYT